MKDLSATIIMTQVVKDYVDMSLSRCKAVSRKCMIVCNIAGCLHSQLILLMLYFW